jgi:serine/tyrosine/threonine adenylyltransferase
MNEAIAIKSKMKLNIKDTFNIQLPADSNLTNTRRQVYQSCFSFVTPKIPSNPQIVHINKDFALELGFSKEHLTDSEFLQVFSGKRVLEGTNPYAMCYGGHQFGSWAGQLGDGRAINLFEVENNNQLWALQLKGSGATPYSRTADGLAVLRSSIREHLCSEAMFHLGVPTTRSLSLVTTGDEVLRDVMYNGNAAFEKGAIVCRVAPSFIRFGNFQIFAARNDLETLKTLTDYTIKYFFPHLKAESKKSYLEFFKEVADLTLEMIIHWQRVGFVHGVMNTDNMSILGLTIDYGPYGWLEGFEPGWTPNTTDRQYKRYAFGNQPSIALWNLVQLANALYPLIEETDPLEKILADFKDDFETKFPEMMRDKLGLTESNNEDVSLIADLENTLQLTETDMTLFFRNLSSVLKTDSPTSALEKVKESFYSPQEVSGDLENQWIEWFAAYLNRLNGEKLSDADRKAKMNSVNPKYVLRNYMAQLAIDAADNGDFSLVKELYELLRNPYNEQPEQEKWFTKRPDWARNKVGCSMLSCSS